MARGKRYIEYRVWLNPQRNRIRAWVEGTALHMENVTYSKHWVCELSSLTTAQEAFDMLPGVLVSLFVDYVLPLDCATEPLTTRVLNLNRSIRAQISEKESIEVAQGALHLRIRENEEDEVVNGAKSRERSIG